MYCFSVLAADPPFPGIRLRAAPTIIMPKNFSGCFFGRYRLIIPAAFVCPGQERPLAFLLSIHCRKNRLQLLSMFRRPPMPCGKVSWWSQPLHLPCFVSPTRIGHLRSSLRELQMPVAFFRIGGRPPYPASASALPQLKLLCGKFFWAGNFSRTASGRHRLYGIQDRTGLHAGIASGDRMLPVSWLIQGADRETRPGILPGKTG